jgi:hypothetical protein
MYCLLIGFIRTVGILWMKSVVHCCLGINSFIMGWDDKISYYGLSAVPVGEQCGVDRCCLCGMPIMPPFL